MRNIVLSHYVNFVIFIVPGLMYIEQSHAVESLIESKIDTRYSVTDNINLTQQPSGNVSSIDISPSTSLEFKESSWNAALYAKYRDRNFSDSSNDSEDIILRSSGMFQSEKNVYSIDLGYVNYSSLSSESIDFAISELVVERTTRNFSPTYQRLITERLSLSLGYTNRDVSYDRDDAGFVPYATNTGTTTLSYSLSERSQVSGILQLTDYKSDDRTNEFESLITRVSLQHSFTNVITGNFSYGTSRRDSIQRASQSVPFFGTVVTTKAETDFSADGEVFSALLSHVYEGGEATYSISRDDQIDSFGVVSVFDSANVSFTREMTEKVSLSVRVSYNKAVAIATESTFSDRETIIFEPKVFYALDKRWRLNASYRYVEREFLTSGQNADDSNTIAIGLTYIFPTISTF